MLKADQVPLNLSLPPLIAPTSPQAFSRESGFVLGSGVVIGYGGWCQVPQNVCCTRSFGAGGRSVMLVSSSVLIGSRQNFKWFLKWSEILMRNGGIECGFHDVVARYEPGA